MPPTSCSPFADHFTHMPVFQLNKTLLFPPPQLARDDGLLAVGGDLSAKRLLLAYRMGIFPWYAPGEPILWWAPDPRLVLLLDEFHLTRRLARTMRRNIFEISMDQAFGDVIKQCADVRLKNGEGTWIDQDMTRAYCELHNQGYAHSVECWRDGKLAGGLYGVSLGNMFFGESMFSLVSDSSKVALAVLVNRLKAWRFELIDCQIGTDHLRSLGAREIPAENFYNRLNKNASLPAGQEDWRLELTKTACFL